MSNSRDSVVLVVMDGWGIAPSGKWNAISQARIPNYRKLESKFGSAKICASGTCVGLSEGQMGNSEVGHLTIGAGRIIFQDLMRVNEEIKSGRMAKNKHLIDLLKSTAKKPQSTLHFLGLVSNGGVHSHIDHLFSLLQIAKDNGLKNISVHAFLDGRDTPPKSGIDFVASLQSYLDSLGLGGISTISGRFYSMDRDNRWDRTKQAYDAIVFGEAPRFGDPIQAIRQSYDEGVTDEFVVPRVIGDYSGIHDKDSIIFFNFRPDRARQLTKALVLDRKYFDEFERNDKRRPKNVKFVSMTIYDPKLKGIHALLDRERVLNTLANVLEKSGIRQLRIAETEKYAHVTYFFNGLIEKPRLLEDRILVPSLKIGTYDKMPEMSAKKITENALSTISSGKYGFSLINFANADMVGHSGNLKATVKAVETVDECLGKIYEVWLEKKDSLTIFVTADHGNAEKLFDEQTKQPHTAHTSNPVPLFVVSEKWKLTSNLPSNPGLVDISPSILEVLNLKKPKAMSGQSIVEPI